MSIKFFPDSIKDEPIVFGQRFFLFLAHEVCTNGEHDDCLDPETETEARAGMGTATFMTREKCVDSFLTGNHSNIRRCHAGHGER